MEVLSEPHEVQWDISDLPINIKQKVIEFDQEIPQLHTADQHMTS